LMDVIFLAFANDPERPLTTLKDEDAAVYKLLSPNALNQHYLLHRDSYATIDSVNHYLTQFRHHIRIFLYSGHAGANKLVLEEGEARAEGIAQTLGQCPQLQLVFLNGCSTKGQVAALLKKGVPAVLATSAKIDDQIAAQFSTRFFQALADQAGIEEAFKLAKGEIQSRQEIHASVHSGLVEWGSDEAEDSVWGLYTQADTDALDWKLPTLTRVAQATTFQPNQLLFSALLKTLAPFRSDIQKIQDDEAMGVPISEGKKFNAIIPALPYLLSEQLAKLMAAPTPNTEMMTFYHQLGYDRLRQIVVTYNRLMELLAFTMTAQLWELAVGTEEINVPAESLSELKQFFSLDESSRSTYNMSNLIQHARSILDANKTDYFIKELKEVAENFAEDEKLNNSLIFLEHLRQKTNESNLDEEEARQLCVIAEEKLALFVGKMGFLANYELTSVKAIDVLNYRHFKKPKFRHRVVNLVKEGAAAPFEDSLLKDQLLDSNSVLILHKSESDGQTFLNLSPFIIDENAFDLKAKDTKLYFFDHIDRTKRTIVFKHSYKPRDPMLEVGEQPAFRVITAQFDAFSKVVFKQAILDL
ncbi:MAG: CHAT domain-containing protein, partial [Saprospiraceae bacterium]|nr:CHAT domain-containing protein [Saprospiraceae bacterium]